MAQLGMVGWVLGEVIWVQGAVSKVTSGKTVY